MSVKRVTPATLLDKFADAAEKTARAARSREADSFMAELSAMAAGLEGDSDDEPPAKQAKTGTSAMAKSSMPSPGSSWQGSQGWGGGKGSASSSKGSGAWGSGAWDGSSSGWGGEWGGDGSWGGEGAWDGCGSSSGCGGCGGWMSGGCDGAGCCGAGGCAMGAGASGWMQGACGAAGCGPCGWGQGPCGMLAGQMGGCWSQAMMQQAAAQQMLEQVPPQEKRYFGTIKMFIQEKSHGFIECPEIKAKSGQDVYVHSRQMHRCEVGDEVYFCVVRNTKGEPQAREVCKAKDEQKFMAKKENEKRQNEEKLLAKRGGMGAIGAAAVMDEKQAKRFQAALRGKQ